MTFVHGGNGLGDFAGSYRDPLGDDRGYGFVYVGGQYVTIDPPGAVSSDAHDIDAQGRIYGSYTDGTGPYNGYVVPEPATLGMLALGGFAMLRRRRRTRRV